MSEGKKFDEGKIRYDLLPVDALREVARVLTFGAAKYGDNNWKITKPESRYTAAAFRHGEAYRGGEMMDKESGIHHLAHRICCDLFLLQIDMEHKMSDAEKSLPKAAPFDILMEVDSEGYPIRLRQVKKFSEDPEEARNRQVKAMTPYAAGSLSLSNEVGDGDA